MPVKFTTARLVGGRLCLDFVNTANWSAASEVLREHIAGLELVQAWSSVAGLRSVAEDGPLQRLAELHQFRAALRKIFLAAIDRRRPAAADLELLNAILAAPVPAAPLVPRAKGSFAAAVSMEQLIAQSAAALLSTEHDLRRIKHCPGANCGWLFLDDSRTRRRRWCAMETCGNRAKARRHYARSVGLDG